MNILLLLQLFCHHCKVDAVAGIDAADAANAVVVAVGTIVVVVLLGFVVVVVAVGVSVVVVADVAAKHVKAKTCLTSFPVFRPRPNFQKNAK